MKEPYRLILASASPRRRELLGSLGLKFEIQVAGIVEHEDPDTDPVHMVLHNSALKADWVAERHPDAYVLGADTTVFVDGKALNKPANLDEARRMLRSLSGRSHTVYTGMALRRLSTGLRVDRGTATSVIFKLFGDDVIEEYLTLVHVLDKAGAYAIQEHGDLIVQGFEGSYTNIVGLPLETTKQILTQAGLL
jgi:septum formation protein